MSSEPVILEGDEDAEDADDVPDLSDSWKKKKTSIDRVGKVSSDAQKSLGRKLSLRMDPNAFRNRFAAKDVAGEAFHNRSAALGALLGNRASMGSLKKQNILKKGGSALQARQEALKREKTRDTLNGFLQIRSTKDELTKKGILSADDIKLEDVDARKQLKQAKKLLSSFLTSRPDQSYLESHNIIRGRQGSDESKKEATAALSSFLTSRPAPQALADMKIASLQLPQARAAENQLSPKLVGTFSGVKVVKAACGWGHTAILDESGSVWVCGAADNGRLGLGDAVTEPPSAPTVVESLKELGQVTSLACGDNHTAVVISGKVYTWGMGSWGRLGLGSQEDATSPSCVSLPDQEQAVAVACGAYHTLVLTESNAVFGFGWNKNGRVGVGKEAGTTVSVAARLPVISDDKVKVKSIHSGQGVSLAVTESGEVYSWGASSFGAHGHNSKVDEWRPKQIEGLAGILTASCGTNHCLAASSDGKVLGWGQNSQSQLGQPAATKEVLVPSVVEGLAGVTAVSAAKTHSLAATGDGVLYSWGRGRSGNLGHGEVETQEVPKQVDGLSDKVTSVSSSWTHSAVVTTSGSLLTFGSNQNGKCGF